MKTRNNTVRKVVTVTLAAVTAVAFGWSSTVARASSFVIGPSVSLASLTNEGAQIVVGDKAFSDFSFIPTASSLSASDISVTPIEDGNGYGLMFTGGILALANSTNDFVLGFAAAVTNTQNLISDVHLGFNGNAIGSNSYAEITESVFDSQSQFVGQLHVSTPTNLTAALELPVPQPRLNFLAKDVQLFGGTQDGGRATMSIITQTFSQVPEPSSVALVLGALALGFVFLRRRRSC